ncbi:unnamed protein product, partial [Didymodactylos carnosus]
VMKVSTTTSVANSKSPATVTTTTTTTPPQINDELNVAFQIKKHNIRTISLIICTFTYLIIGACVFDALEYSNAVKDKTKYETKIQIFQQKHNMSNETFSQLSQLIMNKSLVKHKLRYADSLYFATVVLVLIGKCESFKF